MKENKGFPTDIYDIIEGVETDVIKYKFQIIWALQAEELLREVILKDLELTISIHFLRRHNLRTREMLLYKKKHHPLRVCVFFISFRS